MKIRKEQYCLFAILSVALTMRLLPISTDLPYSLSHDETNYIENALRFGTGQFKMASYIHGALYQIVLFVEYGIYFVLGRLLGSFGSSSDFYLSYLKDPSMFYLLARITAVLSGVGTVFLTHAIALRLFNERVALMSAAFSSFTLLMFQMSFLALADMPAVFLGTLAAYLAVRSLERPQEWAYFGLGSMTIGLAAACKFHVGLGTVTLIAAAFLKSKGRARPVRTFFGFSMFCGALAFAGFCIGLPQFLPDPAGFVKDILRNLGGRYIGYELETKAWLFIFTNHLRNGLGIPLELAALAGFVFGLYKRTDGDILLLWFPVGFYLLFMQSVGFAYHLVPIIPFMLIFAARFLDVVASRYAGNSPLAGSLALAAVVVAPTFMDSVRLLSVLRSSDTKTTAKAWIEAHVPGNSSILTEGYVFSVPTYAPPLLENRASLERDLVAARENTGSGMTSELRLNHYDRLYGPAKSYAILKVLRLSTESIAQNVSYIVMTSSLDSLAGKELEFLIEPRDHALRRAEVKEALRSRYSLLATVTPTGAFTAMFPHLMDEDYQLIRGWPLSSQQTLLRGPTITIWERQK